MDIEKTNQTKAAQDFLEQQTRRQLAKWAAYQLETSKPGCSDMFYPVGGAVWPPTTMEMGVFAKFALSKGWINAEGVVLAKGFTVAASFLRR